MPSDTTTPSPECNCLALRQAARHVTQFYDQCLAPAGLRTTQLSILAKLKRLGPLAINALARELVMDRTTLGRTMLPLERDGLISIEQAAHGTVREFLNSYGSCYPIILLFPIANDKTIPVALFVLLCTLPIYACYL